jgi:hypothetical protein
MCSMRRGDGDDEETEDAKRGQGVLDVRNTAPTNINPGVGCQQRPSCHPQATLMQGTHWNRPSSGRTPLAPLAAAANQIGNGHRLAATQFSTRPSRPFIFPPASGPCCQFAALSVFHFVLTGFPGHVSRVATRTASQVSTACEHVCREGASMQEQARQAHDSFPLFRLRRVMLPVGVNEDRLQVVDPPAKTIGKNSGRTYSAPVIAVPLLDSRFLTRRLLVHNWQVERANERHALEDYWAQFHDASSYKYDQLC